MVLKFFKKGSQGLFCKFGVAVDDAVIEEVLRYGEADIGKQYLEVIREAATEYAAGIMRRLREHEYNPELMKLYVVLFSTTLRINLTKPEGRKAWAYFKNGISPGIVSTATQSSPL